jgi:ADP-heptose:LPS heptosyltransferase
VKLKLDCRHFRGDKPCRFACGCEGCANYAPMGKRILIVKLDAIGDVARTTTILRPLHAKYDPCHITWLVHPAAEEMLRGNPLIDVALPYRPEALEPLRVQRFDLVLSLDKTPRATAVAMWSNAPEKLGFGLSEFGTVFPLNPEAEYAFQLGLDDDLKFRRNRKTYQEVLFEAIKLPYAKEEYAIEIDDRDRRRADALFEQWQIAPLTVVIGLNLGGGSAFANKMWNAGCATAFLEALMKELPCKALLFGAERERATIEQILAAGRPNVLSAGTGNTIRQFQALLARCTVVVTGDSLGMHLAVAEKRPVVALFGPTCAQEIELYGRGEVIAAPSHCAPCYRPECARNPSCMQEIEPGPVVAAVKRWLNRANGRSDG